jgi:hypothetical protein
MEGEEMVGIESRALNMPNKYTTTELHFQPLVKMFI